MNLRSLPLRVLAICFLVLALPLLIDSFIFFQRAYIESVKDAKEALRESANFRALAISEIEPVRQILLKEMNALLDLKTLIPKLPSTKVNQQLKKVETIGEDYEAYIVEREGEGKYRILASNDETQVGSFFKNAIFLDDVLNKGATGDFLIFRYSPILGKNVPYVFVIRVIKPSETKNEVVLMIASSTEDELTPMIKATEERDLPISFGVLTVDKIIFSATDPKLVGNFFSPLSLEQRLQFTEVSQFDALELADKELPVIQREEEPFFEFIFNDEVQIAYMTSIPRLNLYFLAYTTKEILFSRSVQHFLIVYTLYAFIFLIGGGITFWLTNWISRPLAQLTNLMGRVAKGDLDVRFKEEPLGFELNMLGGIFNDTVDSLFQNIRRAEDEKIEKEKLQKELALGRDVQRSLLPGSIEKIPGIELEGLYLIPSEVGGDFYDVFTKDKKHVYLTIADAMGRGIYACIYALDVRSLIRTHITLKDDVGEILSMTNNIFLSETGASGTFVTALLCKFDIETKILTYYSCGHVPALICRANGEIISLEHSGIALGLKESNLYKTDQVQLIEGDLLILYTDGLIDISNSLHQPFSEQRLKTVLKQKKWNTPKDVVDGLKKEVEAFVGSEHLKEEIAILCMKVL